MKDESNNLVNIFGICDKFNLPTKWVKDQVKSENIPCLKIGKKLLFNVQAVEKALADLAAKGAGNE